MELINATYASLDRSYNKSIKNAAEIAVTLLAPFIPHISEELWEKLGNTPTIFNQPWPEHDEEKAKDEVIIMPVMINNKLRSRIEIDPNSSDDDIKTIVLSDDKVQEWLSDKDIKKFMVVSKKLVNIIV